MRLKAPLQQSSAGGSGAFLGLADDGRRYWIKPLNNAQGQRVPITEQIVSRVGKLIGAPTCEARIIAVGQELAGWEFRPQRRLEPGIAHASLHVEDAVFVSALDRRVDDDNPRRHAFLFAVYDWCWGGDVQGLLAVREENRFYSHDHGWYLPPEGPTWTVADLESQADVPHELPGKIDGISSGAAEEVPIVAEDIEEVLNVLFEQFVVEPEARRFPFKKKHVALAAVRRAYREAGLKLGQHFEEGANVRGQYHKERFDFVVANGRAVQLAQTWSFQVPNQEELAEQVKAWAWTVADVRRRGGTAETAVRHIEVPRDVDIQVVYIPPAIKGPREALDEALAAFKRIRVQPVEADQAHSIGLEASRLVRRNGA